MTRYRRLTLEALEDRELLATWGMAWPNPQHVTVSFVPDGTAIGSAQSNLFQTLNSQAPASVWETTILQAIKTWAANTNISITLVNDCGQPIGTAGDIQGDPRFGDIRVAAMPLGSDVVAITSPFDLLAGTRAGGIILNSSDFGSASAGLYDLYTVVLHESGHSFGLPDQTTDPTSVMYAQYSGVRAGLGAADITQIQSLYGGPRRPDIWEGTGGNNTLATAATITTPNIAADITNPGETDFFQYTIPTYFGGSMTVEVQTSGVSLLTPSLTVYNSSFQVISSASSTNPLSSNAIAYVSYLMPGQTYYFQIAGARSDVFGVGSYRLKLFSGSVSPLMIANYDTAYNNTGITPVNTSANASLAGAMSLEQSPYIGTQGFNRAIISAVSSVGQATFYQVVAQPTASGAASTLVATVSDMNGSTLLPQLTVFDHSGNVINANILVNDLHGTYLVQVANATPYATYYIEVSASPYAGTNNVGNYLLGVDYIAAPIVLTQFASDTLSGTSNQDFYAMSVAVDQVTHFVLSASDPTATVATAVRMSIYDQNGNVIFTLDAIAGQTVSANFLLRQGSYTVRLVAATMDGSALSPFSYNLLGETLTDPMDPYSTNPQSMLPPSNSTPSMTVANSTTPPPDPGSPWTPPPTTATSSSSIYSGSTTTASTTPTPPPPTPPPQMPQPPPPPPTTTS
jgi:hypothetical protein